VAARTDDQLPGSAGPQANCPLVGILVLGTGRAA